MSCCHPAVPGRQRSPAHAAHLPHTCLAHAPLTPLTPKRKNTLESYTMMFNTAASFGAVSAATTPTAALPKGCRAPAQQHAAAHWAGALLGHVGGVRAPVGSTAKAARPAPRLAVVAACPPAARPAVSAPRQNHLLAALAAADWARWLPLLEPVDLPLGKVLFEPGSRLDHVVFPTTAVVSLLHGTKDGDTAQIAVVGCEGIVGVSLLMGGDSTTSRAVVQSAGQGFRLKSHLMLQEFNRSAAVLHLMLRYTQALMTQMAQTAVCNRHHSLNQQLCRWLLVNLDRVPADELVVTQELIASLLGVRREGVTEAAGQLQQDGLIRYQRGRVLVLDRARLERRSCECYAVVKNEYARLLPVAACSHARPDLV